MAGYLRLDFGLGYRGKIMGRNYNITANVRNANDKKYYEGLQSKADRRSFRVSVSTKF